MLSQTIDQKKIGRSVVQGLSSALYHVISLDKELFSTLSLSTQVYKIGNSIILLGVTLCWTSILLCGSRKYRYPPHEWSLEILRGGGGLKGQSF